VAEAISSVVKIELKEEKVYVHLDEEKESDVEAWVLDAEVTNHMSGCQAAFTKLDTVVFGTMCFGDDSVAQIEYRGTVVFVCEERRVLLSALGSPSKESPWGLFDDPLDEEPPHPLPQLCPRPLPMPPPLALLPKWFSTSCFFLRMSHSSSVR
jgi:hypothetical protein